MYLQTEGLALASRSVFVLSTHNTMKIVMQKGLDLRRFYDDSLL
jgi:hypothetical protein